MPVEYTDESHCGSSWISVFVPAVTGLALLFRREYAHRTCTIHISSEIAHVSTQLDEARLRKDLFGATALLVAVLRLFLLSW